VQHAERLVRDNKKKHDLYGGNKFALFSKLVQEHDHASHHLATIIAAHAQQAQRV
jgi:hypothetical protein